MVDQFQKDGDVSEDEADRGRKKVEETTSELVKQVETIVLAKEKDVMEV